MAINLVTRYLPYVDEIFTKESKKSLLTNQDFNWTGAHTVKVYKVTTSAMRTTAVTRPRALQVPDMAPFRTWTQLQKSSR